MGVGQAFLEPGSGLGPGAERLEGGAADPGIAVVEERQERLARAGKGGQRGHRGEADVGVAVAELGVDRFAPGGHPGETPGGLGTDDRRGIFEQHQQRVAFFGPGGENLAAAYRTSQSASSSMSRSSGKNSGKGASARSAAAGRSLQGPRAGLVSRHAMQERTPASRPPRHAPASLRRLPSGRAGAPAPPDTRRSASTAAMRTSASKSQPGSAAFSLESVIGGILLPEGEISTEIKGESSSGASTPPPSVAPPQVPGACPGGHLKAGLVVAAVLVLSS